MIKKQILVVSVLFLSLSLINAQDSVTVRDFESWNSVGIEKKFLDKKLTLALEQEIRMDENSSHLNIYFTDIHVEYKFLKTLKTGAGYRFIRNNKKDGFVNEQRLNFDISYTQKIDRLKFGCRFRVQSRKVLSDNDKEYGYPIVKYRFRFKGIYNIKNWKPDPYMSGEIFYSKETSTVNYIETITEKYEVSGFQKFRFKTGISYPIKKIGELGIFYGFEKEFKSYPKIYHTPATIFLAGLSLHFNI